MSICKNQVTTKWLSTINLNAGFLHKIKIKKYNKSPSLDQALRAKGSFCYQFRVHASSCTHQPTSTIIDQMNDAQQTIHSPGSIWATPTSTISQVA